MMSTTHYPALLAQWPRYRAVVEALEAAGHEVTLTPPLEEGSVPMIAITFADGMGLGAWEVGREDGDEEEEEQREWNATHVWMVADLDEDGDVDDSYDDIEDVAGVVGWANELAAEHQLAHTLGEDWRILHHDPQFQAQVRKRYGPQEPWEQLSGSGGAASKDRDASTAPVQSEPAPLAPLTMEDVIQLERWLKEHEGTRLGTEEGDLVADYGRRLAVEMRRLVGGRGVARALVRGLQYDRCPKCGTTDLDPHLLGLIHNLMDALAA